jgi:phage-related holin
MQEILLSALGWLAKAGFWVFVFTRPAHDSMLAVIALVAADFIAGIWAAKKRGEKITSYGIRRTITTKIFPYQFAILCSQLVEQQFITGIPLMKATAGFIAVAEMKSIFENLGSITGLDFWSALKEKIQPSNKLTPKE